MNIQTPYYDESNPKRIKQGIVYQKGDINGRPKPGYKTINLEGIQAQMEKILGLRR